MAVVSGSSSSASTPLVTTSHSAPPLNFPPHTTSSSSTASMDQIMSMLRRLEAGLDASEQRWALLPPQPRPEPDPPYGLPLSWQAASWSPSPIASPSTAVTVPTVTASYPMASDAFRPSHGFRAPGLSPPFPHPPPTSWDPPRFAPDAPSVRSSWDLPPPRFLPDPHSVRSSWDSPPPRTHHDATGQRSTWDFNFPSYEPPPQHFQPSPASTYGPPDPPPPPVPEPPYGVPPSWRLPTWDLSGVSTAVPTVSITPMPSASVLQPSTPIQQGYEQPSSALQPDAVSESAEGALKGNGYEFGIVEKSEEVAAKNLLVKDHTSAFVHKGGEIGKLDFHFPVGAPLHGINALLTTSQLQPYDTASNALALSLSPVVRALFDLTSAMLSYDPNFGLPLWPSGEKAGSNEGLRCRGVYDSPRGIIFFTAVHELESLTLFPLKYDEFVYAGQLHRRDCRKGIG